MAEAQIAGKARFDQIRYAQLWEDADVLVGALDTAPGSTLVSICSAGDNALAMLTTRSRPRRGGRPVACTDRLPAPAHGGVP